LYAEGICFNYGTRYGSTINTFADSPQLFHVNAGMNLYNWPGVVCYVGNKQELCARLNRISM